MKKLIPILFLLFSVLGASAATTRITATITVTNAANVLNGTNYTVNGDTRYATNAALSSKFFTTNTTNVYLTTNIVNQLASYPLGGGVNILWSGTNSFQILGAVGGSMAVSFGSTNWAYVTYSTQTVTTMLGVRVPISGEAYATQQTYIASQLVKGQSDLSTNSFATNSIAGSNFLTKGASPDQTVNSKVIFVSLNGYAVAITNGIFWTPTNASPISSNAINYGKAIRSEGIGANSFQAASNALANDLRTIAIGAGSLATNSDSIAIGTSATASDAANGVGAATAVGNLAAATNAQSSAYGYSAFAYGSASTAIGAGAQATTNSTVALGASALALAMNGTALGRFAQVGSFGTNSTAVGNNANANGTSSSAIGASASTAHNSAVALGTGAATTADNQIRLGTAAEVVSIPGQLSVEIGITNSILTGTNINKGDYAELMTINTTPANGINFAVPFTNVFTRYDAGPTAAWSINSLTGGRDGRRIKLLNNTAFTLTIADESGADATVANRIRTPSRLDTTVITNGFANLVYDATLSRWRLENVYPESAITQTTNGVASVWTNSVAVSPNVTTNINFISGANITMKATNNSGSVDISIAGAAGGGTNTLFQTNGTSLGSAGTVNWTTGVTGYLAGAVANLGVNVTGGSGALQTNANQFGAQVVLTVKDTALVTNLTQYGTANVTGLSTNMAVQTANQTNLANLVLNPATASRVAVFDANKQLTNSAATSAFLDNLAGTVANNVTNVVSLSTSNATSRPITNSYTAGVLKIYGLEAGSNMALSDNGSNIVLTASTSGSDSTNHIVEAMGTLYVSNNILHSVTNAGGNTNVTFDFNGPRWITWQPTNYAAISFANVPVTYGEMFRLFVYWTNTAAQNITWPSTVDIRSNAPALVFGITNIYEVMANGTNQYVISQQELTTPGANGGATVLSNAPSIYAPIIVNATVSRVAAFDAQGALTNAANAKLDNILGTGALTNSSQFIASSGGNGTNTSFRPDPASAASLVVKILGVSTSTTNEFEVQNNGVTYFAGNQYGISLGTNHNDNSPPMFLFRNTSGVGGVQIDNITGAIAPINSKGTNVGQFLVNADASVQVSTNVFSFNLMATNKIDVPVITNNNSIIQNVETRLIPTNNSLSNIVVNFQTHTNFVELYCTNNLTFTNWTAPATGITVTETILIRPQLITRGVNWGNLGLSNPGYGVAIGTNANNLLWTSITNGKTYAISFVAIGTNIFPAMTLWE